MIDYYESLGLEHDASAENIKSVYRQLAKRYHPDVLGGDPVVFSRITEAYEVLSEPARRKSYDQALRAREQRREEALRPQSRPLGAGCIIGSGTVSNIDRSNGSCCLAEVRMLEIIADGKPKTPFMKFGDRVRIEMFDDDGKTIFGTIDQVVKRYKP